MKKMILLAMLFCRQLSHAQDNLVVDVHEGVSLMSTIQYLSGQLSNSTSSSYKTDVKKYFLNWRAHPAVADIFMKDKVYPDLTELGFLFYNFPDIKMYPLPESMNWYKYIPKPELQRYMEQCMKFYKETKFHRFHQSHADEYKQWASAFTATMQKPVSIFNATFGEELKWYICLEPLNDWGAHTYTKKIGPGFKNRITYQQGYFGDKDSLGKMIFRANVYDLAWHEGTHAITDSLLVKYKEDIAALATLMKQDQSLKQQNINDWQHYFDELLARSVSIALFKKHLKPASYEQMVKMETNRGFIHVKDVADVIVEKFLAEGSPKDFSLVLPFIFDMLKEKYK
jgi:hypothetical protein